LASKKYLSKLDAEQSMGGDRPLRPHYLSAPAIMSHVKTCSSQPNLMLLVWDYRTSDT